MKSIFTDKEKKPTEADLKKANGRTYSSWKSLAEFTYQSYPSATEGWNFSGDKYGWSFRISDKKRALIYLLPRDGFFKVAFVFGQKATDEILTADIADAIKTELKNAKVYAEGRGIRLDVKDQSTLKDLKKLISIKISH
ncbi:MAG: DUF3788 domain-containing protein [Chitinophagaceae bacterium]|nr:DUF3788 domain-containing protein [Chitinophagaceae bacterium]